MRTTLLAPFVFGITACVLHASPAAAALPVADPARVRAHVAFLADDLLEGREAGTRGYDLAAQYVASQFAQAGLQPGGDNGGWLQAVPLLRGERVREGAALVLERGGKRTEFAFEQEFLPGIGYDAEKWDVSAPLVFVGQAVVAPEFKHDDLAGVDVRGKIAVVLRGAPARFPNDARALYSTEREKQLVLVERGAVGVIAVYDPEAESRYPWARSAANWQRAGMRLRDAADKPLETAPELIASAAISLPAARRLFEGSAMSADAVFKRLKQGKLRAFDLPGTARISGRSRLTRLASSNVVGVLPGIDKARASEYIAYTAHLDHVGVGAPVAGDAIYNGAVDNALGSALLVETARLAAAAPATARSHVFVAVTAEEKGLLGSYHFARNPGPGRQVVANLNMDMPVILSAHRDAITVGVEHSSLKADVIAAAAQLGVLLTPDPNPEEVGFVRSDQFSFVRQGIPAVALVGGIHSSEVGVDARQQLLDFRRQHYHQPSDQANLSIHYPSAARLAQLNLLIGRRVGDAAQRPAWNAGNFFGTRFATPTTDTAAD